MFARTLLLSAGGLALGATFGPIGAAAGLAIGLAAAAVWLGVEGLPKPGPAGRERCVEHVLCVPHASIVEVEMTRDKRTGQWLDVTSCSICSPEGRILCDKTCLLVMNDTFRRPGALNHEAHRSSAVA